MYLARDLYNGLELGDRTVLKGAAYFKDGDKVATAKDTASATE